MAAITASRAFDQTRFDLNRLLQPDVRHSFRNWDNEFIDNVFYQDLYEYAWKLPSGVTTRVTFGGENLAQGSGDVVSGQWLHGIFQDLVLRAGKPALFGWQIRDFEALATSLAFPMMSRSTADDQAWLRDRVFAGDDRFDLSPYADHALGYAGNDTMEGRGGSDTLAGGAGDDRLHGGGGHDRLDGGTGRDTLMGGAGNDTYVVDAAADEVYEDAFGGRDTVISSVSWSILIHQHLEDVVLTRSGASNATGNTAGNRLTGNRFDNVLDGREGIDTLTGGDGDDTYVVDHRRDVVRETGTSLEVGGVDTIRSWIGYSLTWVANVENLTLAGALPVAAYGNAGNNRIQGNAGNNLLDGRGGIDRLYGGAGDDTYVIRPGTTISEVQGGVDAGGLDTVRATGDFRLGAFLERLWLEGAAHARATGNALDNELRGNRGNNVLDGGSGADSMYGGLGDDTYFVDNAGDYIEESSSSGGKDVVNASVSYSLETWPTRYVEKLVLTGKANLDGTGHGALPNHIVGNGGNNRLDGGGFDSLADTLQGGAGNDTYVVDPYDVVSEETTLGSGRNAGGYDIVISLGGGVVLPAFVERGILTFTDTLVGNGLGNLMNVQGRHADGWYFGGTLEGMGGADTLQGGHSDDTLRGGAGNDSLEGGGGMHNLLDGGAGDDLLFGGDGGDELLGGAGADRLQAGRGNDRLHGGAGQDTLVGGVGADEFAFGVNHSLPGARDTIQDFQRGVDKIDLRPLGLQHLNPSYGNVASSVAGQQLEDGSWYYRPQVWFSGGVLSINLDTDAAAEMQIQVGGSVLSFGDVYL